MLHPRIQDFNHNDACQALRDWVGRRFPKFVNRKGFEYQFESTVTCILQAQIRLAAALEIQLIDRLVRLSPEQRRAQAENLWKSQDITDKDGARDAALRVVDAKPPPTRWRRKLQRLRSNSDRFLQLLADRDIRATIRLGALQAGILDGSGPHWLHYLRDNPDVHGPLSRRRAFSHRGSDGELCGCRSYLGAHRRGGIRREDQSHRSDRRHHAILRQRASGLSRCRSGVWDRDFFRPGPPRHLRHRSTEDGGLGLGSCLRPAYPRHGEIIHAMEDIKRITDMGGRGLLISDEGMLIMAYKMRSDGIIAPECKLIASAHMGHNNPVTYRMLEDLGADTIASQRDLDFSILSALRAAVSIPIHVHIDNPQATGGFIRVYDAPEMVRICSPVYLKTGSSALERHGMVITEQMAVAMAHQVAVAMETLRRYPLPSLATSCPLQRCAQSATGLTSRFNVTSGAIKGRRSSTSVSRTRRMQRCPDFSPSARRSSAQSPAMTTVPRSWHGCSTLCVRHTPPGAGWWCSRN